MHGGWIRRAKSDKTNLRMDFSLEMRPVSTVKKFAAGARTRLGSRVFWLRAEIAIWRSPPFGRPVTTVTLQPVISGIQFFADRDSNTGIASEQLLSSS